MIVRGTRREKKRFSCKGQANRRAKEKEIGSSALFACINSPIFENMLLRWLLCCSVNCSLPYGIRKRIRSPAEQGQQPCYDPRSWIYFHLCPSLFSKKKKKRRKRRKKFTIGEAPYYFKRVCETPSASVISQRDRLPSPFVSPLLTCITSIYRNNTFILSLRET